MKLVDILARELKVWPDSYDGGPTAAVSQDRSGELNTLDFGAENPNVGDYDGYCWKGSKWTLNGGYYAVADDNDTSIVTRAEWQSAVDALKAPKDKAMDIDWSKAPKGATHFSPSDEDYLSCWCKWVGSQLFGWLADGDSKWDRLHGQERDKEKIRDMIARPTYEEWNGEGLPPVGMVCEFKIPEEFDGVSPWRSELRNGHRVEIIHHYDTGINKCAVFKFKVAFGHLVEQAAADCFRPIRTPEQIAAEEREAEINRMVATAKMLDKGWARKVCASLYDAGYRKQAAPCGS